MYGKFIFKLNHLKSPVFKLLNFLSDKNFEKF